MPAWSADQTTPQPPASSSPVPTLLPTNTPLPTATPTPLPFVRVEMGDRAIFLGDWESALTEFRHALETSPDEEVQFAARLGIARTNFLAGELLKAQDQLEALISPGSELPQLAEVYFVLGQVYEAQGDYPAAAEEYAKYLDLRPGVIDSYVSELRGDVLSAAGDYQGAIAAYQAALGAPRLDSSLDIEFKMAQAYDFSGELATAIVAYEDLYSRTANDYMRAQLDYLIGQAYISIGETELAQAAYLDAVMNYPLSYDSYLALVDLVEAGVLVDELQRGLVDYYAAQYAVAIAAFDRTIQAGSPDIATAMYYKGLSQSALGDHQAALDIWGEIIQSHPEAEVWDDAWEQTGEVLWFQMGEYRDATQVLLDFVDQFPAHPRAAEFLFQAARIAERGDQLDQAAIIWARIVSEYPGSELAEEALHLAGITRYRLADYVATEKLFQKLLAFSTDIEIRSAAYFWIGKSRSAIGQEEAANAAWEQAVLIDPTGYYSERAGDLLAEIEPFTLPLEYDLSIDLDSEQQEAEEWMRTIFGLPEETNLSSPGSLAGDVRFQRGNEFLRLGLYEAARAEFEDLRLSVEADPANSYRLANHLLEKGLYRTAIFAARQVLDQVGMDDAETMRAPVYFNHTRFGPYYRELVMPASQEYNFHPLFLFSVMRQESLFEGFVRSSAGARGLMQIIPSTGREIAANADWPPNYTDEDLYRPLVSINLGSDYLNRQRGFMSGDLYGALAAYNGGPGNAMTWKNLVPPDPDLYVEVIRF
ncbi:MAG: tetratricopeptide repeat protein, partial [Anaerolineales bacterium]|nr:tetratricopeptide repeat protein [Anaerolineales bacterium]